MERQQSVRINFVGGDSRNIKRSKHSHMTCCVWSNKIKIDEGNEEDMCSLRSCNHELCINCFECVVKEEFTVKQLVDCPQCGKVIHEDEIIDVLGQDRWMEILEEIEPDIYQGDGSQVKCRCGSMIQVIEHQVNYDITDKDGYFISAEAAEDYAKNRIRWEKCKTNFCATCKIKPYHVGYTWSEYREFVESDRWRFWGSPTKAKRKGGPFKLVWKSLECKALAKQSWEKMHSWGHYCKGFKKEKKCLPCIHADWVKRDPDKTLGESDESFCLICYASGIGWKPCVILNCRHIFHVDCLLNKIKAKWSGPRLIFQYKRCPSCKSEIDISYHQQIFKLIDEADELEQRVKNKAIDRAKAEGLDKDPRLEDPGDVYYQRFEDYVMDKMSFFQCYECRQPYFGGLRECGDNAEADGNFKKEDLLCGGWVSERFGGQSKWDKHGTDYIEYKWRYCWNIAQWFCFGTTHFCQPCHSVVNKVAKKCPGPPEWTIKIKHPDDGSEFPLGCGMCRNMLFTESAI